MTRSSSTPTKQRNDRTVSREAKNSRVTGKKTKESSSSLSLLSEGESLLLSSAVVLPNNNNNNEEKRDTASEQSIAEEKADQSLALIQPSLQGHDDDEAASTVRDNNNNNNDDDDREDDDVVPDADTTTDFSIHSPTTEDALEAHETSGGATTPTATSTVLAPTTAATTTTTSPSSSREVHRTIFWAATGRRYDEIDIQNDFLFHDETQTILSICGKPSKAFPNTHFMRRMAGHLRLGLGRNATKEAILEKICQNHYGDAYRSERETLAATGSHSSNHDATQDTPHLLGKRKSMTLASTATTTIAPTTNTTTTSGDTNSNLSSTVLKIRPVVSERNRCHPSTAASTGRRSSGKTAATTLHSQGTPEAAMQARATALTALTASLQTMATTIRQAEDRLQNLCKAVDIDFYAALMDRSLITNDYLRTHFEEYDQFMAAQKQMVASLNALGTPTKDQVNHRHSNDIHDSSHATTTNSTSATMMAVPTPLVETADQVTEV